MDLCLIAAPLINHGPMTSMFVRHGAAWAIRDERDVQTVLGYYAGAQVKNLWITAHGAPGALWFPTGVSAYMGLTYRVLDWFADTVRPVMAKDSTIWIAGCDTGVQGRQVDRGALMQVALLQAMNGPWTGSKGASTASPSGSIRVAVTEQPLNVNHFPPKQAVEDIFRVAGPSVWTMARASLGRAPKPAPLSRLATPELPKGLIDRSGKIANARACLKRLFGEQARLAYSGVQDPDGGGPRPTVAGVYLQPPVDPEIGPAEPQWRYEVQVDGPVAGGRLRAWVRLQAPFDLDDQGWDAFWVGL